MKFFHSNLKQFFASSFVLGRVSWDEYHVNFMIEKGFDDKYAKNHPEDHKGLDRNCEQELIIFEWKTRAFRQL